MKKIEIIMNDLQMVVVTEEFVHVLDVSCQCWMAQDLIKNIIDDHIKKLKEGCK